MGKNKYCKTIGIVGGMGPFSGIELEKTIFNNSEAIIDQDFPSVIHISNSSKIPSRNDYLLGKGETPAQEIFYTIESLSIAGATVIGIPCNQAHAPEIFIDVKNMVNARGLNVSLINMLEDVASLINTIGLRKNKVGILCTNGAYATKLHKNIFWNKNSSLSIVYPPMEIQGLVHEAVNSTKFGIKRYAYPPKKKAVAFLGQAVKSLIRADCDLIVMGCTEIPLGIYKEKWDITFINPTEVLANSLLKQSDTI